MIDSAINLLGKGKLIGSHESGSDAWHEQRIGAVGGSQVGAILGVNPWESSYTAWAKACGLIDAHVVPSMAMKLGSAFEAPIRDIFAAENPGLKVYETGTWASLQHDWAHANPDGVIEHPDGSLEILEIKFSRLPFFDGLPLHYKYQVLWYMWVTGIRQGRVVAVAGGDLTEYPIIWDEFEVESMLGSVRRWIEHVEQGLPPEWDGSKSTYETVRALSPEISDESVELGDLWEHLILAQDRFVAAETELNKCKSATIDQMLGAKNGTYKGHTVLTLTSRNGGAPFIQFKKGVK
jgi:putative phage-type endonuclease